MKIHVLGAGAWGTALAVSACRVGAGQHQLSLWARNPDQLALMQAEGCNTRYLPGVKLPPDLRLERADARIQAGALATADLVVIATPMSALRAMLQQLVACSAPVVWVCKGVEANLSGPGGLLGHEIAAQVAPDLLTGILTGPSFAQEVARGQPTALVGASAHAGVRDTLVSAFHGGGLRVYASDDVIGAEVGGAVKNVLAIATGLCDGLQLGLNARAALITRGLAEITRLGLALGARAETFMGLSGLGDLVLTATGDLSRNRKVGLLLAQGQSLEQAVQSLGHVAEGVYCARAVAHRARQLGVDMPITQAVVDLLEGHIQPQQALAQLMQRSARGENQR